MIPLILFCSLLSIDCQVESEKIWTEQVKRLSLFDQYWINEAENTPNMLTSKKRTKQDYKLVVSLSKYFARLKTESMFLVNLKKHRDEKFAPFDDVRTLRHLPGFYLAASDVITDEQFYVVTQAPLRHTVKDFWRAVVETRTQTIIKLMAAGESRTDSPCYHTSNNFPYQMDDWVITFKSKAVRGRSSIDPKQMIIERKFEALNLKTSETHAFRHLHYENWPDLGCPDVHLLARFLHIVDENQHPSEPMFVHCKAGVGRSGTFVLAHTLRKKLLRTPESINPVKILISMRMQRERLVSTVEQYQAALISALISTNKPPALPSAQ